jgi:serine/threonine protein kinase
MTDIKQYEPLWGAWHVESLIGEGSFGKVYKVRRDEFGKTYHSAVKMISIPQNEAALRQAQSEGMTGDSIRSYFHAFVMDIIQEVDIMSAFRGNSNIVSFEDHKVIENPDEIGWDILIRMELLASLTEHIRERPLSPDEVIKLGIHICRALELCALKKTIHRDVKPDNIFVSQYGDYKLGDFGIARQIERTMSEMSKKGTVTYMAPEVFKGEDYGASVDTYSLGILMYRSLNNNRTPFQPDFPSVVTPRDKEEANLRRLRGEASPPIPGVDPSLCAIVLKACAYDHNDRFESPTEMREALEAVASGKGYTPPVSESRAVPADAARNETFQGAHTLFPKVERTEIVFSDYSGFTSLADATDLIGFEKTAEPVAESDEPNPRTIGALAIFSGAFFAVLAALCCTAGATRDVFIFLPIYLFCIVQCASGFRYKYANILFVVALAAYSALSFLFDLRVFDYHLFIMALCLFSLSTAENKRLGGGTAICFILAACSIITAVLIVRALGGINSGASEDYVTGAIAIPLLFPFVISAGLLIERKNTAAAVFGTSCLIALQFFPLVAFSLQFTDSLFRGISIYRNMGTLFYIADMNFIGLSPGLFPWWSNWRFIAVFIQLFAFAPFFILAFARTAPDTFTRVFDEKNIIILLLESACLIITIAIITWLISIIPGLFLAR